MDHPNQQIQKNQEEFLKQCPENERDFHASLFRIGNASIIYHQRANEQNLPKLEIYYLEWLQGLPSNIRASMENKGFEECKTMLPFTRYVNERDDIGMDEWMRNHLSEEDYKFYKER